MALTTAAMVAFTLSACSAASERLADAGAAAEEWPSRVVCPEKASWTASVPVINTTSIRLRLDAGSIDCYDWSGVSTPATVFSGEIVDAQSERTYTLEPRDNVQRNWKMRFSDASSGSVIGTLGVALKVGGYLVVSNPNSRDMNDKKYVCTQYPIGADPSKTPSPPLDRGIGPEIYLWSDGTTVFAIQCSGGGMGGLV